MCRFTVICCCWILMSLCWDMKSFTSPSMTRPSGPVSPFQNARVRFAPPAATLRSIRHRPPATAAVDAPEICKNRRRVTSRRLPAISFPPYPSPSGPRFLSAHPIGNLNTVTECAGKA